jgi:glutathione peroxidase
MVCKLCPCMIVLLVLAAASIFGAGLASQPAPDAKPAQPAQPIPKAPSTKPTDKPKQPDAKPAATDAFVLGFEMKRIDGKEEDLSTYKGKVVVMVNVASKCGYTPQYEALEAMYTELKDKGLVILGFPANNFGGQEPGANKDIAEFCTSTYHVTFPLFEKISVKGDDQHPLYKKLTSQPAPIGGDPKWNFTKFVVDQSGNVVARYDAKGDGKDRAHLEPDFIKKVHDLLGIKDDKKDKSRPPAGS